MNNLSDNKILVLEMDLFPDRKTLDCALQFITSSNIRTVKIVPDEMDDTAWANVLEEIMGADVLLAL